MFMKAIFFALLVLFVQIYSKPLTMLAYDNNDILSPWGEGSLFSGANGLNYGANSILEFPAHEAFVYNT